MATSIAYVGKQFLSGRQWIYPASWRRRWRRDGNTEIRLATPREVAGFNAHFVMGTRPVPLQRILDLLLLDPIPTEATEPEVEDLFDSLPTDEEVGTPDEPELDYDPSMRAPVRRRSARRKS